MPGFSNYLENEIIQFWLRNNANTRTAPAVVYLALFTADPTDTGTMTSEVTVGTGSYVRKAVTFAVASGGSTSNTAQIDFTNMPTATITHWGITDSVTRLGGNMLYANNLTASVSPVLGDTVSLAAGALTISHD